MNSVVVLYKTDLRPYFQSADGVPYIGAVPDKPGQWICAGHNGHGMVRYAASPQFIQRTKSFQCSSFVASNDRIAQARIMTAAPGLVKLMQGGSWADTGLPECYEITKERLTRLREKMEKDGVAGFPRLAGPNQSETKGASKSAGSGCTVA